MIMRSLKPRMEVFLTLIGGGHCWSRRSAFRNGLIHLEDEMNLEGAYMTENSPS